MKFGLGFKEAVRLGYVDGWEVWSKFASKDDTLSDSSTLLWMGAGDYPHPVSAELIDITSGAGNSAVTVLIDGVDENGDRAIEEVILDAGGLGQTLNKYIAINRANVAGIINPTVDITFTNQSAEIIAYIVKETKSTEQLYLMVPNNCVAIITSYLISSSRSARATFYNVIKEKDGVSKRVRSNEIYQNSKDIKLENYTLVDEGGEIWIEVILDSGEDKRCSASVNFYLIDKRLTGINVYSQKPGMPIT